MKRFLQILMLLGICTLPYHLFGQQSVVRLTRYESQKISGVSASNAFDVFLVQSDQTKVVVELNQELEERLELGLTPDGIVRVSLSSGRGRIAKNTVMKITVYLPELTYLRGSGATTIHASGHFTSSSTEIILSGASDLKSLNLTSTTTKMTCSGASDAWLQGKFDYLEVRASGASDTYLDVTCRDSYFKIEGASDMHVKGIANTSKMTASGGSDMKAAEFMVSHLNISVSGASDAKVWATESIEANASSASSVKYKGNPEKYNTKMSSAGNIRKMN